MDILKKNRERILGCLKKRFSLHTRNRRNDVPDENCSTLDHSAMFNVHVHRTVKFLLETILVEPIETLLLEVSLQL
jgi:hypothetical protein